MAAAEVDDGAMVGRDRAAPARHARRCRDCRARRRACRMQRRLRELPGERMFASARTEQQDIHARRLSDDDDAGLASNRSRRATTPAASASPRLRRVLKRTVEDALRPCPPARRDFGVQARRLGPSAISRLKDDAALIDAVIWRGAGQRLALRARGRDRGDRHRQAHHLSGALELPDRRRADGAGRARARCMALLDKRRRRARGRGAVRRRSASGRCRSLPRRDRRGHLADRRGDPRHTAPARGPLSEPCLLWPVLVQGEGAAEQVAAAVAGFDGCRPAGRCRARTC